MTKIRLSLYLLIALLTGAMSASAWYYLHNPLKPLYVEVVNDTDKLIPSVIIEHGNLILQEKIMIIRLKPNEKRIIALNHTPGLGFNVKAIFKSGEQTEICAGKNKAYWFFRETITKFGIYTTPIR